MESAAELLGSGWAPVLGWLALLATVLGVGLSCGGLQREDPEKGDGAQDDDAPVR